jgi:hypothetical protein
MVSKTDLQESYRLFAVVRRRSYFVVAVRSAFFNVGGKNKKKSDKEAKKTQK